MPQTVFTVGHSTHTKERLIGLLHMHGITALCDVRSKPYSGTNPQFNREGLRETLRAAGVQYVFLGSELGARSQDPSCYENGRIQYERLARTVPFHRGLDRVQDGAKDYHIALMCAEKEPLECHRTILVARHLAARGMDIQHIHADGRLESHADALIRLFRQLKLPEEHLFRSREELLADAYEKQGDRIAYDGGDDALAPGLILPSAS